MSSIIMHIFISQTVQKELGLSSKFLAGSILPDMIKIKTKKRDETHYIKEYNNAAKRLPDLDRFLAENDGKLKDEVMLGYYAHLIEDLVWFDKYIDTFAKCIDKDNVLYLSDNTIHENRDFAKDIYSDYTNVDAYLIEQKKLDIDNIRQELKTELKQYDVDEIINENVVFPIKNENAKIKFISEYCLNKYIEEATKEVREKMIEILGE